MSKRVLLRNHIIFEGKIDRLIKYGLEIINESLPHKKGDKSKEEKAMLLEALFLRSCAYWGSFVENQIVYLIHLDPSRLKNVMRLPQNTQLNLTLIKALLFSDKYRDFSNIERAKGELKKFIVDKYNVFQEIDGESCKKIEFVYKTRNYLSHYSSYSKNQLKHAYQSQHGYSKFQEPGLFLMKEGGNKFENLIHNFKLASIKMKQKLQ